MINNTKFTSIQISNTIWNELNRLKEPGESFDTVIKVLLERLHNQKNDGEDFERSNL